MAARTIPLSLALALVSFSVRAESPVPSDAELAERFTTTVKPFLDSYCIKCHSGKKPKA